MPSHTEMRKLIAHAAVRSGGVRQLAERLAITPLQLMRYVTGHEAMPDEMFLRVVDVILEQLPDRDPVSETCAKAKRFRAQAVALRQKNRRDLQAAAANFAVTRRLLTELRELRRRS